jgi:hypothetical protein
VKGGPVGAPASGGNSVALDMGGVPPAADGS